MSSTTLPSRQSGLGSRATVGTAAAAVGAAAVAALAVVTFTGVTDDSPGRPAPAPVLDARQVPTPQWLEKYVEPQGTSGEPAARYPARPVNRGLR